MEEPGKIVSDDDAKVTTEGTLEEQDDGEKDDDDEGQEVIKVYILKADSGDDDLGESSVGTGVAVKIKKHWSQVHVSVSIQPHRAPFSFLLLM